MNTMYIIQSLIKDLEHKQDRMKYYDEYLSEEAQVGLIDFVIKSLIIMKEVVEASENESFAEGYDKGYEDAAKTLQ